MFENTSYVRNILGLRTSWPLCGVRIVPGDQIFELAPVYLTVEKMFVRLNTRRAAPGGGRS